MLLTVIMAFAGAQTAGAQVNLPNGTIEVIINKADNANGTVSITYTNSSGEPVTEASISSGFTVTSKINNPYTLTVTPAQGCKVTTFQCSRPSVNPTQSGDVIEDLMTPEGATEENDVYTYSGGFTRQKTTITITFSPQDDAQIDPTYNLTGNVVNAAGATMSLSIDGQAVNYAKQGQVVDVTLTKLSGYNEWSVTSSDIEAGGITQDNDHQYHFTMPANDVTVTATRSETAHTDPGYTITDNSTNGQVNSGETYGTSYRPGETVTLQPVPGSYNVNLTQYRYVYQPGSLSATIHETGEAIALTDNGDGTCSFTMPAANVDVSATFTPNENTYIVHFDANGGIGTMADQGIIVDWNTKLSACTFIHAATIYNFVFIGWNTEADGSGDSYADEEKVTNLAAGGQTVTLYAQWRPENLTVHFNANGGSGTMANQKFTTGVAQALTANAFTRDGYTFVGWSTTADGGGTRYDDSETVTLTGSALLSNNITLYAQWVEANHYAVHFDKNNNYAGSVSMPDQIFTVGEAQALSTNVFVCPGFAFTGWNTKADGSGTGYANGETVTDLAAGGQLVVLYAQWKRINVQISYIIYFDANGGEGTMAYQVYTVYESKKLTANAFTRDGYSFTGWNTKADGTGTSYDDQQSINPSGNMTLYAQWALTDDFYVNGDTYTINTATGWGQFCDLLDGGTSFTGKMVKLGNDIEVSRMAGSANNDFCGTFDGKGHTLTFTSTENVNGVAPFSYVSNVNSIPAVIRNLNVVADINTKGTNASVLVGRMWGTLTIEDCTVGGTIQTSNKYAAGFIAEQNGDANITDCVSSVTIKASDQYAAGFIAYQNSTASITDCVSSVTIQSSYNDDGSHGGFVAVNKNSTGNVLTIEGCVFDGKLLTTNGTIKCGGFIGWRGATAVIRNSLYAPATPTASETWVGTEGSATFGRNKVDCYNSYYTNTFYDATYAPALADGSVSPAKWYNGQAAHTVKAGEGVNLGHAGTATEYSVSGITAYKASDAHGDNDPFIDGLVYNEVLYAGDGEEVSLTLSADAPEGYVLTGFAASAGTLAGNSPSGDGGAFYTLTMPDDDVTVTAQLTPDPDDFSVNDAGTEYTIHTAAGWGVFCDALLDNTTYNRFSGKTVYLGADIGTAQNPVTRMAAKNSHDFCGTFDGGGYTLTVNISSDSDHDYTAPFSYVANAKANPGDTSDSPAAIRNLNVTGTVTATKDYAGGIVGAFWGTLTIENCTSSVAINTNNKHAAGFISNARGDVAITNCLSNVTINSSVSGDGIHAGFIGGSASGVTISITGCAFAGKLLTTNGTTHCAGFVGYNSGTLTFTNSLYAPASVSVGTTESATFARGNAPTVTNCYYTQTLGELQGIAAHTIAAGENVNLGHAGTATEYSVSGITAYKASDAHGDNDPFIDGLVYNEVLYAGDGEEVSLTLSADAPEGYVLTGFAASVGNLDGDENPYTLSMRDEDVTVSASFLRLYNVTFTERGWNGSAVTETTRTESAQAVPEDGGMTQGWYYLNSDVTVNGRINLTGDANLILGDGCILDVEGIYIPQGSTLTIYAESDGETAGRIVSHPTGGAAIGGKPGNNNGSIVIHGGSIEAAGADNCAGIGSNDGRTGGTITIYGGTVTAKGGSDGAAIGGGRNCSGGTIDIYGGDITANGPTDSDTCENGAGIGSGDFGAGGTITIYGGTITTYSRDGAGIGGGDDGDGGTITINGGTITSNKVNQGRGARIGGGCDAAPGAVIINGGKITTDGGSGAGIGGGKGNTANGTVTINGGVINASGSYGIGAGEDGADVAITLGWTEVTMNSISITSSSFVGTVTLANQFYNNNGVFYEGEQTDLSLLAGSTLRPYYQLTLSDDADNSDAIATAATACTGGLTLAVKLQGRKLWKDGAWNTLCLPFSVGDKGATSGHELDGTPLEGATLMTLGNSQACNTGFDATNGTLNLDFLPAKTVEPGVAYIVKWPIPDGMTAEEFAAAYADNPDAYEIHNPVFTGVTVTTDTPADHATTSQDGYLAFVGTYSPEPIYASPATNLYLGGGNTLYYPTATDFKVNACRGWFQLKNGLTAGEPNNPNSVRSFNLSFGDEQTGIMATDYTDLTDKAGAWFDLNGRRLSGKPTRKGLYIHNGRKVVIK